MGGALPAVLRREEARGQRGALAGRGRGPVWPVPVGQVSLKPSGPKRRPDSRWRRVQRGRVSKH